MFAGFEIPKIFIVENSKQGINFNTGYVTNMTFQEVGGNCNESKRASENGPTESRSTCGSKDAAMRIC